MLLLDIFKSVNSGIQFRYKENNQKLNHCAKDEELVKLNISSLHSKRHPQSIFLFTLNRTKC